MLGVGYLGRGGRRRRVEGEIERSMRRLYGYAVSLTGDRDAAQDLLHDGIVRALAARTTPRDDAALRAWLFRIVRNVWIDHHRREIGRPLAGDGDPADRWDGETAVVNVIAVRQGLDRLSPEHREVIALVDLAGFPYAEVATILETPVGTVMSRLSRARSSLLGVLRGNNVRPLRMNRRP
ncbi:RNA polymerase sigma factor [Inquilinus sp. CAU 1745]|uniref:RNA polymerase sigma factor n=1 Tax=Inquilinus sp. CAU 1745 TaxID=3140369 RepID=UPI00325AC6D4